MSVRWRDDETIEAHACSTRGDDLSVDDSPRLVMHYDSHAEDVVFLPESGEQQPGTWYRVDVDALVEIEQ